MENLLFPSMDPNIYYTEYFTKYLLKICLNKIRLYVFFEYEHFEIDIHNILVYMKKSGKRVQLNT